MPQLSAEEITCQECGENRMSGVACHDDPESGVAFNLYLCGNCGTIAKEMVWNSPGILWIPEAQGPT